MCRRPLWRPGTRRYMRKETHKRDSFPWKETHTTDVCTWKDLDESCLWPSCFIHNGKEVCGHGKRPTYMTRDPWKWKGTHERDRGMKRDLSKPPLPCLPHSYFKRDLPGRPMYIKRDRCTWKETYKSRPCFVQICHKPQSDVWLASEIPAIFSNNTLHPHIERNVMYIPSDVM